MSLSANGRQTDIGNDNIAITPISGLQQGWSLPSAKTFPHQGLGISSSTESNHGSSLSYPEPRRSVSSTQAHLLQVSQDLLLQRSITSEFGHQLNIRQSASPSLSGQSQGDALGDMDSSRSKVGRMGPSSSQSFMAAIKEAANRRHQIHAVEREMSSSKHVHKNVLRTKRRGPPNQASVDYILPPRNVAERLLDIHWKYSHIIFPWLDKTAFVRWYESLWTGQEPDPHIHQEAHHCMLNTVFAISYQLDSSVSVSEQKSRSESYFLRAQNCLTLNALDLCHFALIQAFLLMGQYLQSTHMPHQCYQSIGLAIWIAQTMGLHLPESLDSIEDPRERDLTRRVWYGCILMDRITAMTFGRETKISQDVARAAPHPTPSEDDDFELTPSGLKSNLDFFLAYCSLHIILGDILRKFYSKGGLFENDTEEATLKTASSIAKTNIDTLLSFDEALRTWTRSLPDHLQDSPVKTSTQSFIRSLVFRRQAVSLTLRYSLIRILLFRPLFSQVSEGKERRGEELMDLDEKHLVEDIRNSGLAICTATAQKMLDTIAKQLSRKGHVHDLPPWWHVISYTYTAAIVVLAAHLHSCIIRQFSESSLQNSVESAFDILRHYESDRKSAQKCKTALEALREKLMQPKMVVQSSEGVTAELSLESNAHELFSTDTHDNGIWDVLGDNDMWLHSAPFNPNYNNWLPNV